MDNTMEREGRIVRWVLFVLSILLLCAAFLWKNSVVTWVCAVLAVIFLSILGKLVWLRLRARIKIKRQNRRKSDKQIWENAIDLSACVEDIAPKLREPGFAVPSETEKTFLKRAVAYGKLSGKEKRVQMLKDLYDDYTAKIRVQREWEQAMRERGVAVAMHRNTETSWAVMNGNEKMETDNEQIRRASVALLSGLPGLHSDIALLEKERLEIGQASREACRKNLLSAPTGEEIWKKLATGNAEVRKLPSGVLAVSLPVSIGEPFAGECLVIDGSVTGEIWFEDVYIGGVVLPLPLNGIPLDMEGELVLEGMCGRSVEADGAYTLKLGGRQNLWIMEA